MAEAEAGWYPFEAGAAKQASWGDLVRARHWPLAGQRRYWDGTRFVGPAVSNEDITAVATCPGCQRHTGFVNLTGREEAVLFAGGAAIGLAQWLNPKGMPRLVSSLFNEGARTNKCICCGKRIQLCPGCGKVNIADAGMSTCPHCGRDYV